MNSLAIMVATLVVTLILNGPIQSYADPQLDTLVNIATHARDNLNISISQISNVPTEIVSLYQQGSVETDALTKAANVQDIASAKQHFLSAMNFFKATNDKINSLNATETNDQQRSDITKLQSEITRLTKIAETLRTIAITNHADFDFTPFDTSIQQAKQALDTGKINDASKSIDTANQLIIDAHHALSEIAQERTPDRAKDFTEKQIERFNKINDFNTTQNSLPPISNITMSKINSNQSSVESPGMLIVKLRKLVAEGNVDEALKIIKSLDKYQKEKPQNNENITTPSQTNPNTQNNENITTPSQTNPNTQNNTNSNPGLSSTNSSNTLPNSIIIPSNNNAPDQINKENGTNKISSSHDDNSNQIDQNKKTDKIEHKIIPLNINTKNNTDLGSNPVPINSSNSVSIPIGTNSSDNNHSSEDNGADNTESHTLSHDKTHENDHEKIKEKQTHKQHND